MPAPAGARFDDEGAKEAHGRGHVPFLCPREHDIAARLWFADAQQNESVRRTRPGRQDRDPSPAAAKPRRLLDSSASKVIRGANSAFAQRSSVSLRIACPGLKATNDSFATSRSLTERRSARRCPSGTMSIRS